MKGTFWRYKNASDIYKATSEDKEGFVKLKNIQNPRDMDTLHKSYIMDHLEEMINHTGNRFITNIGSGWVTKANHDALRARTAK